MNRHSITALLCVAIAACTGVTGCFSHRQTQQDSLARRKALIARKRRKASRSRAASSVPGNRGYVIGGAEERMISEWIPRVPPPEGAHGAKRSGKKKKKKKKPSNPAIITPKHTTVRTGR